MGGLGVQYDMACMDLGTAYWPILADEIMSISDILKFLFG
jgi:hypothetical protein